jgi:DNA invertase Pin-like site-specific DNA recombinase
VHIKSIDRFSFVAQNERELIHKRQAEGIEAAKRRGVEFGRPCQPAPEDFPLLVNEWECGRLGFDDALMRSGLKYATFWRRLREYRAGGDYMPEQAVDHAGQSTIKR